MTTMRHSRLQIRIERFCAAMLTGMEQNEAYKLICPRARKMTENKLSQTASKFANRPEVVSRMDSILASTPAEKIMPQGKWGKRMVEVFEMSVKSDNLTAAAAFGRLVGQYNGAIKDTQVTVNQWKSADDDLLRQLAGDDPAKLAAVQVLLGKSSFESDTKGPDRAESETKH